jgi:hypothetical protein
MEVSHIWATLNSLSHMKWMTAEIVHLLDKTAYTVCPQTEGKVATAAIQHVLYKIKMSYSKTVLHL